MTEQEINTLLELQKKFYHKLCETIHLTQELSEGLDRQDPVSLDLFLAMRQRAILELQEIFAYIDLMRVELSQTAAVRLVELRAGAEAQNKAELPLVDSIAASRRLMHQLAELDERVNRRLCGEQSVYRS